MNSEAVGPEEIRAALTTVIAVTTTAHPAWPTPPTRTWKEA